MAVDYKIIGADGREYVPAHLEELRHWCEDGRVGPATPVWRGDESCWKPAGAREELRWDLPQPNPPPLPLPTALPGSARPVNAGFFIRLAAWFIDTLLLQFFLAILTSPWSEPIGRLNDSINAQLKSNTPNLNIVLHSWLILLAVVVPAGFAYFVGFNATLGATPGKRVLGLRIIRGNGTELNWKSAFLRHCGELVSGLTFGFGYLLILINRDHRALHDLLADTRVVWVRKI